jgi:hypothetical protein
MVNYICDKCKKVFVKKSNLISHQNRKFNCDPNAIYHIIGGKIIPGKKCADMVEKVPQLEKSAPDDENDENDEKTCILPIFSKKEPYHTTMCKIKNIKKNDFPMIIRCKGCKKELFTKIEKEEEKCSDCSIINECHNCRKIFKLRKSLVRHVKECVINNTIPLNNNECNNCHKVFPLRKCLIRHVKTCTDNIENINECSKCRKVFKLKNNLLRHIKTCVNSSSINNISNQQINMIINNTQNKSTHNIIYVDNRVCSDTKINPFGKENLEFLTDDFMKSIIIEPEEGIIRLIQKVHFNKDQPENQNIQIKNKKEPYIDVFNGKSWEKQDKKTAIQNIITTKKDIMDGFIDENEETTIINQFVKENYEIFSDMLNDYVRQSLDTCDEILKTRVINKCMILYKEICKQAELLIINNKNKSNLSIK